MDIRVVKKVFHSAKEMGRMLTLTRKVGESIRIGNDIEIVVKEIRRNQVRIGIIAPRDVPIYREEVYDNLKPEDGDEDPES